MKTTTLGLAVFGGFILCAASANAATIYSEDFEALSTINGGNIASDGVSSYTLAGWAETSDFTFLGEGANLLRPGPSGNGWLSPMPSELGTTFATLHAGTTATIDLDEVFLANTTYTLTFTNFRRDDTGGSGITGRIATASGNLASVAFGSVDTTDTFLTRTVSWTTTESGSEVGEFIRIQFLDNGPGSWQQAGIDNVLLTATAIPEPSAALLGGLGLLALLRRRRA